MPGFPGVFLYNFEYGFRGQLVEQQPGGKGQPNGHVPRLLYINSHSVPPFRFEYWLRCWNFTVPAEGRRGGILRRERMGPAAFFYNDGAEIFSSLSAEQILPRIMGTALAQGLPIAGYQI